MLSASYYFRFYLARALDHAGMADKYLDSIGPWRKLLPLHFSTWPEVPGNTRSDSHAWSAHPIYDFLTLVAGIEPASPGFATVRIAPHLGSLPSLTATYPHPQGEIKVEYQRKGDDLPANHHAAGQFDRYLCVQRQNAAAGSTARPQSRSPHAIDRTGPVTESASWDLSKIDY